MFVGSRTRLPFLLLIGLAGCRSTEDAPVNHEQEQTSAPSGPSASVTKGAGPASPGAATPTADAGTVEPAPTLQFADGPATSVVTNETIVVDGNTRKYVLAVPDTYTAEKLYRLIVVFHSASHSGVTYKTKYPIDTKSGGAAIVAFASSRSFGWDLYTPYASNEDNHFVEQLITHLKGKFTISPQHVFGDGHSSGAFLLNQLACRRSTLFRAISSDMGGAPDEPEDPKASTWPGTSYVKCDGQTGGVPALVIHGTADTQVSWQSGDYTATYWASLNGCADSRSATTPSPCVQHDGCPADKPVVFCLVQGLGHQIWSRAAETSWAFIKAF
jgi:polyhydroxybutyrate depolymerase